MRFPRVPRGNRILLAAGLFACEMKPLVAPTLQRWGSEGTRGLRKRLMRLTSLTGASRFLPDRTPGEFVLPHRNLTTLQQF